MTNSDSRWTNRRKMAMAMAFAVAALLCGLRTGALLAANEDRDHRRPGPHERQQRRELEWRDNEWRDRHPNVYVAPGYYYAPPPVVYAPPPVPPSLNFVFPLEIR